MNIRKSPLAGTSGQPSLEELALIKQMSQRTLAAEEVYTFGVRLCDNQVDRDGERFPRETLEELAPLFVGKSGIFDHNWSAKGQAARIYRTQLVLEDGVLTAAGDPCCYLKGYAYMLRTPGSQELIAEIEGGIKREVSVGCAVKRAVCSICGQDIAQCPHEKGQEYDGRLCYADLLDAADAYEFSFVAVPSQPEAGVMHKSFGKGGCGVSDLERLGRKYLEDLRRDVICLGALADKSMDAGTLRTIVQKLGEEELLAMRRGYEKAAGQHYPLNTQLEYGETRSVPGDGDKAFLI